MTSAQLAEIPGIMTGAEFERRAGEFYKPILAKEAWREKARWNGINVELRGETFAVPHAWAVKHDLKAAGFRWNNTARTWETESPRIVAKFPELVRKAKGAAKDALVSVRRLQDATDTFARAEARLAAGDVERVKGNLTPAIATAIRDAMKVLAADDQDKATVINGRGFSKADTELGHTLLLMGVSTYTQAALALKLTWKYRAQLPQEIIHAAFHVHTAAVDAGPTELTLEQAAELIAQPVADVLGDIQGSTVAIIDGNPEFDARQPPFMRETRKPVARVEGGAVLLLVSRAKLPLMLELRLAG